MDLKFIAYGMNHTTAPVAVREKFALPPDQVRRVLKQISARAPEAVFLSTCNRVEFYLATEDPRGSVEEVMASLNAIHRMRRSEAGKYFYLHEGPEAFLHLFRVASSLDSMVLGETQISGQVKDAFQEARQANLVGSFLAGVFERAFAASKRVRSQTEIARMPTSVSSVAVDLAKKIFRSLSEHQALLLGAGEMSELTAKYLTEAGVGGLTIANRTLEKARSLAAQLGGRAVGLEEAVGSLGGADILITSVGGGFLLRKEDLERAMRSRGGKPLFVIDIGVPRNVEPSAADIESLYLYNIDDLSQVAEGNRGERRKAVEGAEGLLRQEVDRLCAWRNSLELTPTIVRLRERFEGVRAGEWARFLARHPGLSDKEKAEMERLTRDLVSKLLHGPSTNLKKVGGASERLDYARMLNEIFSLLEEGPRE